MESTPNARTPSTPNVNSTPGETSHPDSSLDLHQRTSEILHKLREDVVIFRDPQVRNHLETIPLRGQMSGTSASLGAPTPASQARQQAMIIALRTNVAEAEAALKEMKAADLKSRKRAARAEGQLSELRTECEAQEHSHRASIDAAASRIRSLQGDKDAGNKAVDDERARLAQRVEELRLKVHDSTASRDSAVAQHSAAKSRSEAAETELLAIQKSHAIEKRSLQVARDNANQREASLHREVEAMQSSRRSSMHVDNEHLTELNRLVQKLQEESVQLKSELKWVSAKLQRCEKDLRGAEEEKEKLRAHVRTMGAHEAEITHLRQLVNQMGQKNSNATDAVRKVVALTQEKEQLCAVISSLSVSNDVQDGLAMLQKLSTIDPEVLKQVSNNDSDSVDRDVSMMDLKEAILEKNGIEASELELRCSNLQAEVLICKDEMQSVAAEKARSDQLNQLLQRDIAHLQSSLSVAEKELNEKQETGDVNQDMTVLQNRTRKLSALLNDYRAMINELGKGNAEKDKKLDAVKNVTSAESLEQMKELEVSLTDYKEQVTNLEAELKDQKLKLEQGTDAPMTGAMDFDPKVCKVMHLDQNPLSCAIEQWKAEQESMKGKKRLREPDSSLWEGASKAEVESVRQEMVAMKAEYDELHRRAIMGDRTKNVALKRIEEVRHAVYNLFGWSMKVNGTMYMLSSMYAESESESLHFCVNESGGMSMIDSAYAQRLSKELEQYVDRMDSYPALLSHVTMVNFEKTTAFIA